MNKLRNALVPVLCTVLTAYGISFLTISFWSLVRLSAGHLYWPFTNPGEFFLVLASWWAYPLPSLLLSEIVGLMLGFLIAVLFGALILTFLKRKEEEGEVTFGLKAALSLLPYYLLGFLTFGVPYDWSPSTIPIWLTIISASGLISGYIWSLKA